MYSSPTSYDSPRTPDATLTPPTSRQWGTYFDILRSFPKVSELFYNRCKLLYINTDSEITRLLFYLLNFILYARCNILVLMVNIVGIPTCSQHLLTWFVRRPDDGHIRTETCSLTHNKMWCAWRKLFYHFNIEL